MSRKDNRPSHITVGEFLERHQSHLQLKLSGPDVGRNRKIQEPAPNRPGLALSGYLEYFAWRRIQVIGAADRSYLMSLPKVDRIARFEAMCAKRIPCIVVSRGRALPPELAAVAKKKGIAVFRTPLVTMSFLNEATILLEHDFAPTKKEHGSMVDVQGIGVFVRGKSGIGKSESVLGILERGGSLVADDVVQFRLEGHKVMGTAPEAGRFHMEVRGIGIINVPALFGVRSMRIQKRLDMVVTLRPVEDLNKVDRIGADRATTEILGRELPHVEIPVAPGRDLSRLIQVAAMDQKLRTYGHDAAIDFTDKILQLMKERRVQ